MADKRKGMMASEGERQEENSSDTRQILEGLYVKVESKRIAMRERDAEVLGELKAMGGRFEEVSGQGGERAEAVEELRGQVDQLHDRVQQSMANAGATASSGEFPAGKSAREKQMEKLELGNDVAMWRRLGSRRHWVLRGRNRQPPGSQSRACERYWETY